MTAANGSSEQITIKLITNLPKKFHVPTEPLAVPANLSRYGLSKIVNHLLALDPTRPFDFLIQGEILRVSLHAHLLDRQITTEAVLEVEYIPAVLPPEPKEQHAHADWVGAVASIQGRAGNDGAVVSGCYDGVVRVWRDGAMAASFTAHKGPIKAAATAGVSGPGAMLLTSGDDCTTRAWRWNDAADVDASPELVAVLKGHKAGIEAVAVAPSGARAATGGWDQRIFLWRSGDALISAAGGAPGADAAVPASKKKRKVGAGGDAIPAAPHEEAPLTDLSGHSQCVSGLAWPSEDTLVSGSWDHSVCVWDLGVQARSATLTHNKAVHCVASPFGPSSAPLVAFGGAERGVHVWDSRSSAKEAGAVTTLMSHTDWVSALAWHPTSPHHLLSVSYDATAKLWDVRASVCPLHTLTGAGDKLLACGWTGAQGVAMGGADTVLRTARVEMSV